MHKVHDLFTVGSGEAMLQLIPPFQCRRHCQSVAMPIEPGDIGMEGPGRTGEVFLSISRCSQEGFSLWAGEMVQLLEARLTTRNTGWFCLLKSRVTLYQHS